MFRGVCEFNDLFFGNPVTGLCGGGMIKVSDGRFCEGLAESRHSLLPLLFADNRQPVDVVEVMHRKLRIRPQRTKRPTVKVGHVEQHSQFSVLFDKSFKLRHKVLVIFFYQFSADVNGDKFPAVVLSELNRHIGFIGLF